MESREQMEETMVKYLFTYGNHLTLLFGWYSAQVRDGHLDNDSGLT